MARIRSRIEVRDTGYTTPCWITTRATQPNGYTKISVGNRTRLTHRVAYEATHSTIAPDLTVDHLCRVRACCNPDHLEAVTNQENPLRGIGFVATEAAQTHCKAGHPFTTENTYLRPDRTGRVCRECSRRRNLRYRSAA